MGAGEGTAPSVSQSITVGPVNVTVAQTNDAVEKHVRFAFDSLFPYDLGWATPDSDSRGRGNRHPVRGVQHHMRRHNRSLKVRNAALLIALIGIGVSLCPVLAIAISQGGANGPSPPRLVLSQQKEGTPSLVAHLINSGSQPLILNVGMMLANGRQQFADRIQLQLTRPDKTVLHLRILGPGVIAGRVDPMIIPLPSNATYSVQLDLNQYSAPKEHIWKLDLPPGSYAVRAEYTGVAVPQRTANLDVQGLSLMPYWTGTIQSGVLNFTVR
jgi:hypothetical protein